MHGEGRNWKQRPDFFVFRGWSFLKGALVCHRSVDQRGRRRKNVVASATGGFHHVLNRTLALFKRDRDLTIRARLDGLGNFNTHLVIRGTGFGGLIGHAGFGLRARKGGKT